MRWRAIVLAGCCLTALGIAPVGAAAEVRAGAAQASFELPAHVPLAGYSRRRGKPSEGVHDPVGVQALVIRDGDATLALASCDLLIIDERLFDAVRDRLRARGLPPDLTLLLAGTHTHSGPGAYGTKFLEKISMGHFDPRVFEAITATTAQTVARAYVQAAPVRLAYATARTDGLVVNRVDPGGAVDPDLIVVGFYRQGEGDPFSVLTSFSAHPTTLGAWNRLVSADYPGVVARELERRWPDAVCLFFAGAVADQAPAKRGEGFERAESLGRPLAEQAAAALEAAAPAAPDRIRALQERLALPPAQVRLNRLVLPHWLGRRFVDDDATLSVAVVGRVVFIGAPCDLAVSFGTSLKAAATAHGFNPMVIGFANDYIGYCVPEALYEAKQYESSMAFNGPKAGELVAERLIEMMDRVSNQQSAIGNQP